MDNNIAECNIDITDEKHIPLCLRVFLMDNSKSIFVNAYYNDKGKDVLVGESVFTIYKKKYSKIPFCWLDYICVDNGFLQKGVGDQMFALVENMTFDKGIKDFQLKLAPFGKGAKFSRKFFTDRGCSIEYFDECFSPYELGYKTLKATNLTPLRSSKGIVYSNSDNAFLGEYE